MLLRERSRMFERVQRETKTRPNDEYQERSTGIDQTLTKPEIDAGICASLLTITRSCSNHVNYLVGYWTCSRVSRVLLFMALMLVTHLIIESPETNSSGKAVDS